MAHAIPKRLGIGLVVAMIAAAGAAGALGGSGSGTITTIAGTGTRGFSGDRGPATKAKLSLFAGVAGVAVDGKGNVYIADYGNNRVRKISPGGKITTIAGNGQRGNTVPGGQATSAIVWGPGRIAVDAKGNVYITVATTSGVFRISPDGTLTLFAGGGTNPSAVGDGGPATSAYLGTPGGLAVDKQGNVYIAQTAAGIGALRVRMVRPDGIITTFAVVPKNVGSPSGGLAVDGKGNVYVGTNGHTVYKVSPGGKWTRIAGSISASGSMMAGLSGDGGAATKAKLNDVRGVAVDGKGNVYIADTQNSRVRKVTPGGRITTFAGIFDPTRSATTSGFSGDGGPATKARLAFPGAVAVDAKRNVYIGDAGNSRVRKVRP
jgi:trimeric autotransporter adhesin